MIDYLKIEGYKSIDKFEVNLKNFNLFVGGNSVGKSSVIQGLLIFSQNITERQPNLSGQFVSMESYREIRNFRTRPQKIILEIEINKNRCVKEISENSNLELVCNHTCLNCSLKNFSKYITGCNHLNYNANFHYLSADRIGNIEIYDKNKFQKTKIGLYGEYAIDYFDKNKSTIISEFLIKDFTNKTLSGQVNYWLNYITGYELKTEKIEKTDFIKGYYLKDGFEFRGRNVGAGLGYLISILILCLSSKKNDIIIIENPEIHLHPKAQALLTEFLIFISNGGVQVIIETHSDHIFNGTRIGIKEKSISKEKISVNYFDLTQEFLTKHTEIKFNDEGRILNHEVGLFEQFDLDINRLLGI